jgi:hypothetical protein
LIYISKALGPFDLDPDEHAKNCVLSMQQTALDALAEVEEIERAEKE